MKKFINSLCFKASVFFNVLTPPRECQGNFVREKNELFKLF